MAEIFTFGRVLVDLYANELHTPLQQVGSFSKYLGGSAGNTAIGLARLGARTGLISRVGRDQFGEFLLHRLEAEGVCTAMVKVDPDHRTALAFAALFPPGDSDVLFYRHPCADTHVTIDDLDAEAIRAARLLVVNGTALSASPSREAVLWALDLRRRSGGQNVMDLDWRPGLWADHDHARLYYRTALKQIDIVLANELELAFAGGSDDPAAAAAHLMDLGAEQVVAKRGGDGVILFRKGAEPLHVPPLRVNVVNTLGAGDGFAAAYCFGLLQGWTPERIAQFANAAGALVVSRHSCSEAMPTRAEVESLIGSAQ